MQTNRSLGEHPLPISRRAIFAVLLTVLLASQPLYAQELPFKHYTPQNEINPLPKPAVLSAYQDSLGYLWITNFGLGLVRYDGQAMEEYAGSEGGLGEEVWGMREDRYGRLWVMTGDLGLTVSEQPLSAYSDSTRVRFADSLGSAALYRKSISFPLNRLAVDARGWVWLGTNEDGIIRYRFDGPDTVVADTIRTAAPEDDPDVPVVAVIGRRDGSVWASLQGGRLLVFEEGGLSSTVIGAADVPCEVVESLYEDASGTLWGGCRDGMLWRLSEGADVRELVQVGPTLAGLVTSILEVAPGTLWVSGLGSGVWEVDAAAPDRAVHYTRESGLLDMNVWGLTRDREGDVWVAQNTGLSRLRPNHAAFRAYSGRSHTGEQPVLPGVEALAVQPDVRLRTAGGDTTMLLAVGTGEGLALIREDGTAEHLTTEQGLSNNVALGVCLDGGGHLWVGTRRGADLITFRNEDSDPPRSTAQRALNLFGKPATLSSYIIGHVNACKALLLPGEPGGGEMAVCFAKGVGADCLVGQQWFAFRDASGLPGSGIWSFVLDAEGHLYVGGNEGLYRSTIPLSVTTLNALPAREAEASVPGMREITQPLFEPVLDASGAPMIERDVYVLLRIDSTLWAASTDLFILEGSSPRLVARLDGADVGGAINSMTWSPQTGTIWVGGEVGLAEIDPASREAVRRVTKQDGLLDDLASGPGALAVGANGTVYYGSAAGLTLYRPELDQPNAVAPLLAFRRVAFSEDHAGNNELDVAYAALSFADEKQVRYRTRLVGYDEDWSPPTSEASIRYTNLSAFAFPKAYAFEVVAANDDGVWTEAPLTHTVRVRPAWWLRWWALLIYGIAFLGCVFGVDRVQRRRLVARERERTRERELEQAREIERAYTELKAAKDRLVHQEKMASLGVLTAGIAHEIKNPLNFVNNFAELSTELADELAEALAADDEQEVQAILQDLRTNTQKISAHGRRADSIVQSMMQHARSGASERQAVDLNVLVEEHVELAYHGKRATTLGFEVAIERDYDAAVGTVEVAPQEMGRVVLNLVGNAFDAVQETAGNRDGTYTPTIRISTRRVEDEVEVRVADNGPGIPRTSRSGSSSHSLRRSQPDRGLALASR